MIAIPLDTKDSTLISSNYEKAPYFAFLDTVSGHFKVKVNEAVGDELQTAKFLKKFGISDTIFYKMGKDTFEYLSSNKVRVYTCAKVKLSIDEIYRNFINEKCKLLTKFTSETYIK